MIRTLVLLLAIISQLVACAPNASAAVVFKKPEKWTSRFNKTEDEDLGLWPQAIFNYRHGKWLFEQDVNPRLQYHITRLNELHLRTFVGYRARPWVSLWIGCYPWAPVFEPNYVSETRLLQQISLEKSIRRATFSLRSRLEQRWLEHTNEQTSWRIRTMPRLNYWIDEKKSVYVFTADELFLNFNTINKGIRQGIAQNRLYAGVGYALSKHTRMEVAYLNQWLHRRYHVNNIPNRFNHNIVMNLITSF